MSKILLFSSAASWLMNILYTVCLFIDGIIYYFVALTYKVFYVVSRVNLFGDAELKQVTDRVYMVLGVFMLFVFAYNILTLIVNPDNLGGKDEKSPGGLAKNMIISIVILTLLPTAFNYLHKIQNSVLESNVIGNMILGGWSNSEESYSISEAGTTTSLLILSAFYHPIVEGRDVTPAECSQMIAEGLQGPKDICTQYIGAYIQAQELMKIRAFTLNDVLIDGIYDGEMEYLPIISAIAGFFAAYLFLSFSIDVGVRMVKFAFLQIIAPVPVILRITKPKGGTFSRWVGEMTNTYFALFIRLAFIFFCMYVISLVPTVLANLWTGTDGSLSAVPTGIVVVFANVIIILGILSFAKSGPKMFEDLFKIEHLDISIKKKLGENEYAMRGMTAMSGMTRGALQGGASGAFFGAKEGWKKGGDIKDPTKIASAGRVAASEGMKKRNKLNEEFADLGEKGLGGYLGHKWDKKYDDLKGKGTTLFDESLAATNNVEASRKEFSDELVTRTDIGRREKTRDEEYNRITSDFTEFEKEYDREMATSGRVVDKNGNVISRDGRVTDFKDGTITTDGQFRFGEYVRAERNKDIDTEKFKLLEDILKNTTHQKHEAIMSQIGATVDSLKEDKHLLSKQIDKVIEMWNEEGVKKMGSAFTKIVEGDLDRLESEMKKATNAELTVKIMDTKMKGLLADASVHFKSEKKKASDSKK